MTNQRLQQIAYELLGDFECTKCDFSLNRHPKLQSSGLDNVIFETDYECSGCGSVYEIKILERNQYLKIEACESGIDSSNGFASIHQMARKDTLYAEVHPAKSVVQALREITKSLLITGFNYQRIIKSHENICQSGRLDISPEFDLESSADLHNYLASVYSFKKIFDTVEGNFPADESIKSRKKKFREKYKIINGLRIYAQHNLNIPFSYTEYDDSNIESRKRSITVDLDDISGFDYNNGFSHHYGEISGGFIDVDIVTEAYQRAANQLVKTIWERTVEIRSEEIMEYLKLENHIPVSNNE